jgi:hypothetical protein
MHVCSRVQQPFGKFPVARPVTRAAVHAIGPFGARRWCFKPPISSCRQFFERTFSVVRNTITPSALNGHFSRRDWLCGLIGTAAWAVMGIHRSTSAGDRTLPRVAEETFAFIRRCARRDGGYAPSPDPKYPGNSDTGSSDLAAVTYAATLAKTMGWRLPHPERSLEFIQRHITWPPPFTWRTTFV